MKVLKTNQDKVILVNGDAIQGNSNEIVEEKDINFFDYDGTLVESWTVEEAQTKTELPANPTHEGLTALGWNWTLQEIQEENGMVDVGQQYTTDDGASRLFITIPKEVPASARTIPFNFYQSVSNGVEIDWGDGSQVETITGTYNLTTYHYYENYGDYVISCLPINDSLFGFGWESNKQCLDDFNSYVTKVYFGENIWGSANYGAFRDAKNLSSCIFRNNNIGNQILRESGIKYTTIPKTNMSIGKQYVFYDYSSINRISFPKNIVNPNLYGWFASCKGISRVLLPRNIIKIDAELFRYSSIIYLDVPSTVTTMNSRAFEGVASMRRLTFKSVNPPTASNTYVFASFPTACMIQFPYDSTDYLSATNYPNPATYIYMGYGTFTSGTTLPTTVSTYTLTWYANQEDATSQTNPITIADGNKNYCRYS